MKSLTIYELPFMCVRLCDVQFADRAAIYVILCVKSNGKSTVVDVGQSGELQARIDGHNREDCWRLHCPSGNIWVCVYRMPSMEYTKQQRLNLEGEIREHYSLVCGKR